MRPPPEIFFFIIEHRCWVVKQSGWVSASVFHDEIKNASAKPLRKSRLITSTVAKANTDEERYPAQRFGIMDTYCHCFSGREGPALSPWPYRERGPAEAAGPRARPDSLGMPNGHAQFAGNIAPQLRHLFPLVIFHQTAGQHNALSISTYPGSSCAAAPIQG